MIKRNIHSLSATKIFGQSHPAVQEPDHGKAEQELWDHVEISDGARNQATKCNTVRERKEKN